MADWVTDTKLGSKYFAHADQMSGFKTNNKKDVLVWGTPGGLKDLFLMKVKCI